jgi:hypothetical protein
MDFNDQLNALIFFHLEEHTSGRHLIQNLKEDDFAREHIAPEKGISKSSFFEAMNDRGLEQFLYVFNALQEQARTVLPQKFPELGQLVAIDGSLIDSVLSMTWADYRGGAKKAKTHIGFDINRGIPRKIFLTAGNEGERPFVSRILLPGELSLVQPRQAIQGWTLHLDNLMKSVLRPVFSRTAWTSRSVFEFLTGLPEIPTTCGFIVSSLGKVIFDFPRSIPNHQYVYCSCCYNQWNNF